MKLSKTQRQVLAALEAGGTLEIRSLVSVTLRDRDGKFIGIPHMGAVNGLWTRKLIECGPRQENARGHDIRFFALTGEGRAALAKAGRAAP